MKTKNEPGLITYLHKKKKKKKRSASPGRNQELTVSASLKSSAARVGDATRKSHHFYYTVNSCMHIIFTANSPGWLVASVLEILSFKNSKTLLHKVCTPIYIILAVLKFYLYYLFYSYIQLVITIESRLPANYIAWYHSISPGCLSPKSGLVRNQLPGRLII